MSLVNLIINNQIATIAMNRAEKRNALSKEMIHELIAAAEAAEQDDAVRVVVLRGEGKLFCAGADLEWMKDSLHASREDNLADAKMISDLMQAFSALTKPLIARIHGAAIGAGVGLVATADIAIASDDAIFSFSEVRLGIIPSVVAPYVVPKIGASQSRRYFITGERISAVVAKELCLIHDVVPAAQLDETVADLCQQILTGGPQAVIAAKQMVRDIAGDASAECIEQTITKLAEIRITPEAQEGMTAFFEKRKPQWVAE